MFRWRTGFLMLGLALLGSGCAALPSESKTATTDDTTEKSNTSGSNSPVALPPVASDPSFILIAHFNPDPKGTSKVAGQITKTDGTPVSGETVTAVLTRTATSGKTLKSLQLIPETLSQIDGDTAVSDKSGAFAFTFEEVELGDKVFVGSPQSNAVKLDSIPPTIESMIDINSNVLSIGNVTEVRADSFFLMRFSESMLKSSINDQTVTIACDAGAIPVTVTTSVDVVGVGFIEYKITPTYNLPPLAACSLTIAGGSSGVVDLSDNRMTTSATFALKTGPTKVQPLTQWLKVEDVPSTVATEPSATAVIGTTTYSVTTNLLITSRSGDQTKTFQPQPGSLGGVVKHVALAQGFSMLYLAWGETNSSGTEVIYMQHFDGAGWVQDGSGISDTNFTAKEPAATFIATIPYISYLAGDTKTDQGKTSYTHVVKRGQ